MANEGTVKKPGVKLQDLSPKKDAKGGFGGTNPNKGGSIDPNKGGSINPNAGGGTDPNTGGGMDQNIFI